MELHSTHENVLWNCSLINTSVLTVNDRESEINKDQLTKQQDIVFIHSSHGII